MNNRRKVLGGTKRCMLTSLSSVGQIFRWRYFNGENMGEEDWKRSDGQVYERRYEEN